MAQDSRKSRDCSAKVTNCGVPHRVDVSLGGASINGTTMMTVRFHRLMRRAYPILGAGVLLQAGACTGLDFSQLAAGLTTAVVNELITGIIFGSLNLVSF